MWSSAYPHLGMLDKGQYGVKFSFCCMQDVHWTGWSQTRRSSLCVLVSVSALWPCASYCAVLPGKWSTRPVDRWGASLDSLRCLLVPTYGSGFPLDGQSFSFPDNLCFCAQVCWGKLIVLCHTVTHFLSTYTSTTISFWIFVLSSQLTLPAHRRHSNYRSVETRTLYITITRCSIFLLPALVSFFGRWFQPINQSWSKYHFNSVKLNSWAVPSYYVPHMLHVMSARRVARDCTRLRLGHLGVRHGDSSRHSEETVTNLAFKCDYYQYHYYIPLTTLFFLVNKRKVPGSNPACDGIFSGSSHTSDLNIGTPVATLPGAWRYRVSAGTGLPGVSILWLGEMESLICNFYLSVAARKLVWADPSLRYTRMLLGR